MEWNATLSCRLKLSPSRSSCFPWIPKFTFSAMLDESSSLICQCRLNHMIIFLTWSKFLLRGKYVIPKNIVYSTKFPDVTLVVIFRALNLWSKRPTSASHCTVENLRSISSWTLTIFAHSRDMDLKGVETNEVYKKRWKRYVCVILIFLNIIKN